MLTLLTFPDHFGEPGSSPFDGVDASSQRHHSANVNGLTVKRGKMIHGRSNNHRC